MANKQLKIIPKQVYQFAWLSGKASALGAIDSGLIPGRVEPMTLKSLFIASVLDAQH